MHDPTEGGVATGLMEIAAASGTGLEVVEEGLRLSTESERLCSEYDLDPLGLISSGALLIGCADDSVSTIESALVDADIQVDRIATVREESFGLQVRHRDGALTPLPRFEVDEIGRLFT
jgi:hydrogenase maturation factor